MFKREILPNGVRVVIEEIPSVYSVAIGLWIGCGSRDESKEQQGISHFLEHLFFKGTQNRTAKEIAETFDSVGGHLNAFTTKEYTCIYARVLAEHVGLAIDVLSDMFFNSLFNREEIEKEKKVVLEEIKMYDDTPDELVHDLYSQVVWPEHPLGRPILGTQETVARLTRDQIIDYYQNRYNAKNLVIAVAGNIRHEQVVEQLAGKFGNFKRKGGERTLKAPTSKASYKQLTKDTEQLQVCLGVPGLSQEDPDIYALIVLNNVLGGGLSSRLFQEVREERGLAYSIYSYHTTYIDTGLYTIYAGTSPENFEELIQTIFKQIYSLKTYGIDKEELQRSKQQVKGNLLLGKENTSHRMSRLGKTELCYNRIITVEEIIDSVNKVTSEDVQKVAQRLFVKDAMCLATIGKVQVGPVWEKLLANLEL